MTGYELHSVWIDPNDNVVGFTAYGWGDNVTKWFHYGIKEGHHLQTEDRHAITIPIAIDHQGDLHIPPHYWDDVLKDLNGFVDEILDQVARGTYDPDF